MPSAFGSEETGGSSVTSLLFWLALVFSAAVYAAVATSPKLLTWIELRCEFRGNQLRLVTLEREVRTLHEVVIALEQDSGFAAQLARAQFGASRPGEERIPVDERLSLAGRPGDGFPASGTLAFKGGEYFVRLLATHDRLRATSLAVAATTVLLAFTFLQIQDSRTTRSVMRTESIVQRALSRYRVSNGE